MELSRSLARHGRAACRKNGDQAAENSFEENGERCRIEVQGTLFAALHAVAQWEENSGFNKHNSEVSRSRSSALHVRLCLL